LIVAEGDDVAAELRQATDEAKEAVDKRRTGAEPSDLSVHGLNTRSTSPSETATCATKEAGQSRHPSRQVGVKINKLA
jgi:hypothetical protein